MKNSILFIISNFFSLMKKLYHSLPSLTEAKNFIYQGFFMLKGEVIAIKHKSKNLLNTNIELGLYHFFNGNIEDAKIRFHLIKIIYPNLPELYYNLGRCYLVLQKIDQAIKNFTRAIKINKDCEEACYYLKKIQYPSSVDKIPINVISQYFNYISQYFISYWLVAKQYKGHEYVGSLIINFYTKDVAKADILDLGCGTGICAHFLKANGIGNFIVGVDISNNMLAIARKCLVNNKEVYDQLINGEITRFLEENQKKKYDIIILAEILHYIGDLRPIFQLLKNILTTRGMIIGLVRRRDSQDFAFIPEGDFFCYSEDYILSIAEENNLAVPYTSYCKIYGNQVDGLLFVMSMKNNRKYNHKV